MQVFFQGPANQIPRVLMSYPNPKTGSIFSASLGFRNPSNLHAHDMPYGVLSGGTTSPKSWEISGEVVKSPALPKTSRFM